MEHREVTSASFFQGKLCSYKMCDTSGIIEFGPRNQFQAVCICKKEEMLLQKAKQLPVQSDDETRQVEINK